MRATPGAPSSRRFAPSTRGESGVIERARTQRQRRNRSRTTERRWQSGGGARAQSTVGGRQRRSYVRSVMAHLHSHGDSHDHTHGHGHGHGHSHSHGHGGHQHAAASTRALAWSLGLTAIILVAEGLGGWLSNSLALLADAGHVLTDAGALGLSLFVAWLARQPGSAAKTYGYLRWEILAALINGATLLVISVWIVIEAVVRFKHPEPVAG